MVLESQDVSTRDFAIEHLSHIVIGGQKRIHFTSSLVLREQITADDNKERKRHIANKPMLVQRCTCQATNMPKGSRLPCCTVSPRYSTHLDWSVQIDDSGEIKCGAELEVSTINTYEIQPASNRVYTSLSRDIEGAFLSELDSPMHRQTSIRNSAQMDGLSPPW